MGELRTGDEFGKSGVGALEAVGPFLFFGSVLGFFGAGGPVGGFFDEAGDFVSVAFGKFVESFVERIEFCLLGGHHNRDFGRATGGEGVGASGEVLFVVNVGEESAEGVEVFGGVGIVFVIVALRAADGRSHPDGGDVADAVGLINGAVFGLLKAPSWVVWRRRL